jgi:hypothetical protein
VVGGGLFMIQRCVTSELSRGKWGFLNPELREVIPKTVTEIEINSVVSESLV